jgi:hypothetical protein
VAGTEAVFEDLPAGVYAVHAVKGAMALARPVRLRVEAGQTASARVAVVSGRLLYVAVSSRDGEPTLAPYGVRIRDGAGGAVVLDKRPGPGRALSGAGASAVLPPGKYWVTLDRNDRSIAEREVVVPKDDGAFAAFEIRADDK